MDIQSFYDSIEWTGLARWCSQSVLPNSSSSVGAADVRRHARVGTAGSLLSAIPTYSEHSP
eukprot:1501318-Pyramimonas_sp.AAC.1